MLFHYLCIRETNRIRIMEEIIIIIVLILLNGLFAMSEVALISARKSSLSTDAKKGNKAAKTALKLANEPDRFLSTIQIGITLIGILTGIYSGATLADNFGYILQSWGIPLSIATGLAQTLIVIIVTYLTLISGELLPKRIGMSMAERMSLAVARPMNILSIIAAPLVWILSKSTALMFRAFGLKENENKVTEEEIKNIIQEGTDGGAVQEVEQDIMERVFHLGDLKVKALMTHRSELISLDISMTKEEILHVLEQDLYQMYPVIDRTLDNIKGVITLKSLVPRLGTDKPIDLPSLISSPLYFPSNMSVYKALEKMKESRVSHALVCDEFGTCQGVISMKDIMRGLVGEIDSVQEEPDIIKRADMDSWLIDGQCPFYDFLEHFGREDLFEQYPYNTIGGLILETLEHIPQSGETLDWDIFHIEVVDMDGARIDKLAVSLRQQPE